MKLIRYFNRELVKGDLDNLNKSVTDTEDITDELKFEIIPLEYKCIDEEFNYWLDVIEKTYSMFGEITTEDVVEPPTKEEVMIKTIKGLVATNKTLAKQVSNLSIENNKNKEINKQLAQSIAQLNIKINNEVR